MEKKNYEAMMRLKSKIDDKTANFKERNIWNIIQNRKRKGQKIHFCFRTEAMRLSN